MAALQQFEDDNCKFRTYGTNQFHPIQARAGPRLPREIAVCESKEFERPVGPVETDRDRARRLRRECRCRDDLPRDIRGNVLPPHEIGFLKRSALPQFGCDPVSSPEPSICDPDPPILRRTCGPDSPSVPDDTQSTELAKKLMLAVPACGAKHPLYLPKLEPKPCGCRHSKRTYDVWDRKKHPNFDYEDLGLLLRNNSYPEYSWNFDEDTDQHSVHTWEVFSERANIPEEFRKTKDEFMVWGEMLLRDNMLKKLTDAYLAERATKK